MMKKAILVALLATFIGCGLFRPTPATQQQQHALGSFTAGNGWFFYAAGTAGTYTVPSGAYVTSYGCHASAGGATLTITPSGPSITSPVAGPAIPIPTAFWYSVGRPVLFGNANELGAGSTLVFAGTDSYAVTLYEIGGP